MSKTNPPKSKFHDLFPRPGKKPETFFEHVFYVFSSFKLAIILLSLILVISAIATIFEAQADADYAHYMIYRTKWFEALLVLLGITIITAAFSRWPWQRRHTGFLITHLGLITTLVGSTVSRYGGWEGQLALEEDEQGRSVRTKKQLFSIRTPNGDGSKTFNVQFKYNSPEPSRPQSFQVGSYRVTADKYYPSAQVQDVVEPGGDEFNPAIKVWFESPMASTEQWLLLNHPKKNKIDFGPAQFKFVVAADKKELESLLSTDSVKPRARGFVHVGLESGKRRSISLAENFDQAIQLNGVGTSIQVTEYYENAVAKDHVQGGGLDPNPALLYSLFSKEQHNMKQDDWLFYQLPQRQRVEFGGIASIELRVVNTEEEHEAYTSPKKFLKMYPKGQLWLRLPGGKEVHYSVTKILGQQVKIEGTDLKLQTSSFLPHAIVNPKTQELESASENLVNPTISFTLHGPAGHDQHAHESHTLFANYPTFDKLHRDKEGKPYIEGAQLLVPRSGGSHITIVAGPGKRLSYYSSSKSKGEVSGELELGKPVDTNWVDLKLMVMRYEPNAVNRMEIQKTDGSNPHEKSGPVIRVNLKSASGEREYVLFGKQESRDRDTFPSGAKNDAGVTFMEFHSEAQKKGTGNSLSIISGPDGSLHYVIDSRKHGRATGKVEIQKSVPLSWMPGAKFSIEEYTEQARIRQDVVEATSFDMNQNHLPAVHAIIEKGGQSTEGWIWWGVRHGTDFDLAGEKVNVALYYERLQLDFDVKLIDFRDVPNPGGPGEGIASFESDVDFLDTKRGLTRKVMIAMNNPMEYNGMLFFQSSYIKQPSPRKDISIFSVSYDPGIKMVYVGFSLVCCGIFTMFYIKPHIQPHRRKRSKTAPKKNKKQTA